MLDNKMILNASAAEYSGEYENDDELWQVRAYKLAIRNIDNLVKESKEISKNNENIPLNKTLSRVHDALFISGGRGTGKTVFLYNLSKKWKKAKEENKVTSKVEFLSIIDPTLLMDHDNFVNVVIAHIHSYLQSKLSNKCNEKQEYYRLLGKLAESLGQSEYNHRDASGLDRIVSYQSAMDLERNFHEYIQLCTRILGVETLVLPIDDVDMALNQAHDVLETLRRLLSCPQLIPIVCGDEVIYHQLLENHFRYAGSEKHEFRKPLDKSSSRHLTKQYWRKIFPQHLRIVLSPLNVILPMISIQDSSGVKVVSFEAEIFQGKVKTLVCPLVNGQEDSHTIPMPDTPRKLVQFTKNFYPYINQQEKNNDQSVEYADKGKSSDFWLDFMLYSKTIGYGRGYLVADSEWSFSNNSAVVFSEIPLFNLIEQSNRVIREQIQGIKDNYKKMKDELQEIIGKEDKKTQWGASQLEALKSRKEKLSHSIIQMPPIEVYKQELFISNASIDFLRGQVDITVKQKQQAVMLLNLFTHSNYYGSSGYTIHQLFFGKAFEVFGQTLFQSIKNVDEGVKLFERIKFEAPMHSIYAVAPTKTYHSDDDKQSQYDAEEPGAFESNGTTSPLFNTEEVSAEKEFFKKIIDWQIENEVVLNKARSEGLSHLFSFVFNKVFNRLHLMREQSTFIKSSSYGSESKEYFSDNLYHVSRRFQFVVLTAIGSFLKDKGPVVQQNTGMTPNSDRFMAPSAKSIDRAYQVNVDAFLLGEETQNRLLMEAIVKHPIFSIYDGYDYKDQTMRGWLLVGSNFQGGFRSKLRSKTRATRIVEVDDEKITKIAQKKNTENSVDHIPNIAAMNTSMQLMKALKNEPKIFLNKVKREQLELVYENSFEEGVVFIELILSMNKNATNNKKIKELGVLRQRFIDELKVNKK